MVNHRRRPRPDYDSPAGCPPRLVWLVAGILIGMFVSFLFYLREVAPRLEEMTTATVTTTTAAPSPATLQGVRSSPATGKTGDPMTAPSTFTTPQFEFYDKLPKAEVTVPTTPDGDEVTDSPPKNDLLVTTPGKYILQVGSFRDKEPAEGLKAHLNTLGITAQVGPTVSNGENWYRVQVGPFTNLDELNQTRSILLDNDISTILLKF